MMNREMKCIDRYGLHPEVWNEDGEISLAGLSEKNSPEKKKRA